MIHRAGRTRYLLDSCAPFAYPRGGFYYGKSKIQSIETERAERKAVRGSAGENQQHPAGGGTGTSGASDSHPQAM